MVFFDLPVKSKADRKEYAEFRKNLIKSGFVMIQYSVYSRTVRNNDDAAKYERYIESIVPKKGAVRLMTVTEKQYAGIKILAGGEIKERKFA